LAGANSGDDLQLALAHTGTVRGLGGLRMADLRVPTPESWVVIATFYLCSGDVCWPEAVALDCSRMAALLSSALWIGWVRRILTLRRGVMEVTSIDVGEGDSSLIVTPEGKTR